MININHLLKIGMLVISFLFFACSGSDNHDASTLNLLDRVENLESKLDSFEQRLGLNSTFEYLRVSNEEINIRTEDNASNELSVIARAYEGDYLQKLGVVPQSNWYKVQCIIAGLKIIGYVHPDIVQVELLDQPTYLRQASNNNIKFVWENSIIRKLVQQKKLRIGVYFPESSLDYFKDRLITMMIQNNLQPKFIDEFDEYDISGICFRNTINTIVTFVRNGSNFLVRIYDSKGFILDSFTFTPNSILTKQ